MIKLTEPNLSHEIDGVSVRKIYINMIKDLLATPRIEKKLKEEKKKVEKELKKVEKELEELKKQETKSEKELTKLTEKRKKSQKTKEDLDNELEILENLITSEDIGLNFLEPLDINNKKKKDEILESFFTLTSSEIIQLKDDFYGDYNKNNRDKDKDRVHFRIFISIYSELRGRKYRDRQFNYIFSECSGVKVCPYCNRNFINNAEDEEKGYQSLELDHSIPKSEYPIFALSINNFIPSCGPCNHRKSTTDFKHSLYSTNKKLIEPKFKVSRGGHSAFKIEDSDFHDYIDTLKINEFYQMHNDEVRNIEKRIQMYPEKKVIEIAKMLNMEYSKDFYFDFVFGLYLTEDILNTPLGKFKREIAEDLLKDIKLANS